jgi:hypothetical protein
VVPDSVTEVTILVTVGVNLVVVGVGIVSGIDGPGDVDSVTVVGTVAGGIVCTTESSAFMGPLSLARMSVLGTVVLRLLRIALSCFGLYVSVVGSFEKLGTVVLRRLEISVDFGGFVSTVVCSFVVTVSLLMSVVGKVVPRLLPGLLVSTCCV